MSSVRPGSAAATESLLLRTIAVTVSVLLHAGVLLVGLGWLSTPPALNRPPEEEVLLRLQPQPPAAPVQPVAPEYDEPAPEQVAGKARPPAKKAEKLAPTPHPRSYQQVVGNQDNEQPAATSLPTPPQTSSQRLDQIELETSRAASKALPLPPAEQSSGRRTQDHWQARVLAHLQKHRRYPRQARALRQQGRVSIQATVNRAGRVLALRLYQGSGHILLDQAALATVQRAQPLPALPDNLPDPVRVQLQVEFTL